MLKNNKKMNITSLWKDYQGNRTLEKRNQLIEYYFSFVEKISYKLAEKLNWKVQAEELASFGIDGLLSAIESFNLDRGVKFESYASSRVRGSMIDGLRREDIIPRGVRITNDQFEKHKQRLQNHLGRRLSDVEFLEMIGFNEEEYYKNYKRFHPITFSSLDNPTGSENEEELKHDSNLNLKDTRVKNPESQIVRKEFFSKLLGKNFSKTERKIIYLYYYKDLTMEQIANIIGFSESRVSQIHSQILSRLKDKINRNPGFFNKDIYGYINEDG